MRIEWTETALDDLAAIGDFIARDSHYYARQFIGKILTAVERLEDHPEIGRRVPEAGRDDVRELIYRNYRIIYLVTTQKVQVLTVVHGRRDLASKTKQPWGSN